MNERERKSSHKYWLRKTSARTKNKSIDETIGEIYDDAVELSKQPEQPAKKKYDTYYSKWHPKQYADKIRRPCQWCKQLPRPNGMAYEYSGNAICVCCLWQVMEDGPVPLTNCNCDIHEKRPAMFDPKLVHPDEGVH